MEYGEDTSPGKDASYALKRANIYYMVQFIIAGILCFILYNTGSKWLGKITSTEYKESKSIGVSLVCRLTSSLVIFHLVHAIATVCNKNLNDGCQFMFHIGLLPVHTVVWLALWVAFWFIPDPFFDGYMKFSMVASGIYLLIQIVFLVAFFHEVNDKLVNDDKICLVAVFTAIITIGSIAALGSSFYIFVPEGCSNNNILIGVNLAILAILFLMSMFIEHGSIFTASLIFAYCAYLTVAGCICEPSCNRLSSGSQGIGFSIVASLFTLAWCGYSAFASTNQFTSCSCSEEEAQFSISFYHLLYAFASCYLTMIVTSWGKTNESADWTTDRGTIAKWVNFTAGWITMVLYLWTLVAPYVCKDREFN